MAASSPCAVALAGAAGAPAGEPRVRRVRIGEQRAQRRLVAGRGVGQPPPPEREIHPLGVQQGQPVLGQRGIGAVVVRFASTQPELGALSAEQVPAVLRRERVR